MTDAALAAALAYAAEGWPVFPCRPGGKEPATITGFRDATTDQARLRELFAEPGLNVALHPGPARLVVIDIDGDGAAVAHLPETDEVRTPRGGRHLYYSLPPSAPAPGNAHSLGPKIDVRSASGYVLVPPSAVGGRPYEWVRRSPFGPTEAPLELMARLQPAEARTTTLEPPAAGWDRPADRAMAVRLVMSAPEQPEGGRDNACYRLAARMRELGVSRAEAAPLIHAWNAAKCTPPMPADQVEGRISSVYDKGNARVAPGVGSIDAVLDQLLPPPPPGRFRPLSWAEMRALPPVEWLVVGTLPKDALALLYGPPGSLKTFAALDLSLSIAAGLPWAGAITRGEGHVLYLSGEGSRGIRQRAEAWALAHPECGGAVPRHWLVPEMPLFGEAGDLKALAEQVRSRVPGRLDLTVVDTAARAMAGLDENSAADAGVFVARADELRRELGGAILVIHHTGKDAGRGARGSSVLPAAADTVLSAEPGDEPKTVILRMDKQKDAAEWGEPKAFAARQHGPSLALQPTEVRSKARDILEEMRRDALLAALDEAGQVVTRKALAIEIARRVKGDNPASVSDWLRRTAAKKWPDYAVDDAGAEWRHPDLNRKD